MGDTLDHIADFGISMELWGIGRGIDRLREEQLRTAQEIVAGLGFVEEAINRLEQSLERQTTVIQQGFSQLDDRLESFTILQAQALRVMKYRRDTDALAARENGEKALRNRYYDEALDDFRRALDDNKYDFIAHFLMALILWEEGHNRESAIERCNACIRYSKMWSGAVDDPTSQYYESRAHVLLGRIAESEGQLPRALSHYLMACHLSPDYAECFRRCGAAALALGDHRLALQCVKAAMSVDPGEFVRMMNEPAFESSRRAILAISEKLRNKQVHALDAMMRATEDWATALAGVSSIVGKTAALHEEVPSLMERVSALKAGGFIDVAYVPTELTQAADVLHRATIRARDETRNVMQEQARIATDKTAAARNEAETVRLRGRRKADEIAPGYFGCAMLLFALLSVPLGIGIGIAGYNSGNPWWIVGGTAAGLAPAIMYWMKTADAAGVVARADTDAHALVQEAEISIQRSFSAVNHRAALLMTNVEQAMAAFLDARRSFDKLGITCSLILVDPGSCESAESAAVVETLRDVSDDLGQPRSASAMRGLLLDLPATFARNSAVFQAEDAASFIRREFGFTVGVKRRYTRALRRSRIGT